MSLLEVIQDCSTFAGNCIQIEEAEKMTGCQAMGVRALSALQLIVSIVATPLILVVGLLEALFIRSFQGEFRKGMTELGNCLKFHLLLAIPVAAHGMLLPLSKTERFIERQLKFFTPLITDPNKFDRMEVTNLEPKNKLVHLSDCGVLLCC